MVRFIISEEGFGSTPYAAFTFQYGQIYYEIKIETVRNKEMNLHSNMVRFIIFEKLGVDSGNVEFTFQYGQIYYKRRSGQGKSDSAIYIPIWLDLLFGSSTNIKISDSDLHSNMVRFIMQPEGGALSDYRAFTFQYGQIYY